MEEMSLTTIKARIRAGEGALQAREHLVAVISSGADKNQILSELEDWRVEFRNSGDAQHEDTVLDLMDFLVGWCSPTQRL